MIDEVLAVGDTSFQKKCLGKMDDVLKNNRTVFFVSHDMLSVQSLCTKAILLQGGKVVFEGSTDDTIAQYLNLYEQNQESIETRTDRTGGEAFRFTEVQFVNPQTMTPLTTMISGQPVLIRIGYQLNTGNAYKQVGIGISFFNYLGSHLFACRNKAVGTALEIQSGRGFTECLIEKWPLKGGRYFFNLFAEDTGLLLDWVKKAGFIDVVSGDYYGYGVLPGSEEPGVLIDYLWKK
jgi:lipopolysaccharide transport system ATP-binding protein